MKKLCAALFGLLLASAAQAQSVTMPPPAGTVAILCVYNTSPPTLITTNVGFVQCDSTGKLIVSGGGGGGGAVTIADGADVAQGAKNDAAYSGSGDSTVVAALKGMYALIGGPIPTGTNIIGKVGIDQTTPGTTNAISSTNWPAVVDTNSGNKSASTPRYVIATDQPNLTTPLNVNTSQFGGSAVATGTGAAGAGVPRFTVSDDAKITLGPASIATSVPIIPSSQYPGNNVAAAAPVTISTTGTTAATTATIAAVASKTAYLCGFSIRATATAAAVGNATVTGTISGTLNFTQFSQAASTGLVPLEPNIGSVCIPASAANTAINVISAAPGTGGVVSVSAWGYYL